MAFPETGGYGASSDAPVSDPMGDSAELDDAGAGYDDEETAALAEAFPDMASDPARLEAFKTAVKICVENAMNGGSKGADRGSSPPPPRGKGGGAKAPSALILALGKPPKKASG